MENISDSFGQAIVPAAILLIFVIVVLVRRSRRRGGLDQREIRAARHGRRQTYNKPDERQDFDTGDGGNGDGDGGD